MNLKHFFIFFSTLISFGFAEARKCDSKDLEFIKDVPSLQCMACEMEFIDADFQKQKNLENKTQDSSNLKTLEGPTSRYWGLLAVTARQIYSNKGELTEDQFKAVMIRLASATGPCRKFFYANDQSYFAQLQNSSSETSDDGKNYKKEKSKKSDQKYNFPDFREDETSGEYGLINYANPRNKILIPYDINWSFPGEDKAATQTRREHQPRVAAELGFAKYMGLINLMKITDSTSPVAELNNLSDEDLRKKLRANFTTAPSASNFYSKEKEGAYLKSCIDQIKNNLAAENINGPKSGDVCTRLTRACFATNTENQVQNICSNHGLVSSGGSVGGGAFKHGKASPVGPHDGQPVVNKPGAY